MVVSDTLQLTSTFTSQRRVVSPLVASYVANNQYHAGRLLGFALICTAVLL